MSQNYADDVVGNRVKVIQNGQATLTIGNHAEWQVEIGRMTKYYYANGQRIAMRVGGDNNNNVSFPLTDHLGSTSVTLNYDGTERSELRYMPFGETRYTSGDTPTQRRFTGQIEDSSTGLYFYNARYYDPTLGRFIQPDAIVPEPGNPQSLNRYSYVYNNPLRYTDPTGFFTNEAIATYLNENYPDEAGTIWGQWYNNEDWWNMLQTAEAGDILFGRIGGVSFFFRFEGEGNHKLTGISFLGTDRTCSCEDAASGLTLRTLAEEGSITYTGSGSMSHELEPKWIGFVRGLDEIPALYIRTGYKWKSTAYSDWQRKKLSYTVGVGVGVLCHFAACPALVSILGGTGTAITAESTVGEIFHMGPTDVTVNILHIKTRYDYNIYFSKESLDADGWYIEGKGGRRIQ